MEETNKTAVAHKSRPLSDEFRERRQQLLNALLRNFEVARLNLHDTQLSADAGLINFYEAAALSLDPPLSSPVAANNVTAETELEDGSSATEKFTAAARLLELERSEYWLVGLHARYNLIVLRHREIQFSYDAKEGAGPDTSWWKSFGELEKEYVSLRGDLLNDRFAPLGSQLEDVAIAAACGHLSCLCTKLKIANSDGLNEAKQLEQQISTLKGSLIQLVNKSCIENNSNPEVKSLTSSIRAAIDRMCPPKSQASAG